MKKFLILAWLLCLQCGSLFTEVHAATLSAGSDFNCAVLYGGAYCWGGNADGQLGANTTVDHIAIMTQVPGLLTGVTAVSAAGHTACAVQNGAVFCWGSNSSGQLGVGQSATSLPRSYAAMPVVGLSSGVTDISVGESFACAIQQGFVYCWGDNSSAHFGNGGFVSSTVPVRAARDPDDDSLVDPLWQRVSLGLNHACGLYGPAGAPRLYCWGLNAQGQILGHDGENIVPDTHVSSTNIRDISLSGNTTCAIIDDVTKCWGNNASHLAGQIAGDPSGNNVFDPAAVFLVPPNLSTPMRLSVGASAGRFCALNISGLINCWGSNNFGGLGNFLSSGYQHGIFGIDLFNVVPNDNRIGTEQFPSYEEVPTSGLRSGAASGPDHTCFWGFGGATIFCLGRNDVGQLGLAAVSSLSTIPNMILMELTPPVITSPLTASGTQGTPFSYQLASNQPATFSATGLPPGLSLNNSGLISGTPTAPGSFAVTVTATYADPSTTTLTINIVMPPPVITSPTTATGSVAQAFTYQATANQSVTFTATGLPPGLSMSTGGLIAGTPGTAGSFSVVLTATNASQVNSTATLVITILPPPAITSAGFAAGTVGAPFTFQVTANEPVTFGASGLPPGLTLNTTSGVISGAPTVAGSFTVGVTATNVTGAAASGSIAMTVLPPVAITSPGTANGTVGSAFSFQLTANQTATFAASGLPPGLSLNASSGVISGTPTAAGNSNVTVTATNATGVKATGTLAIVIALPPPTITSAGMASATVGAAFSFTLTANQSVTFGATGLPSGLTLNTATGAISGTPGTAGSFNVTATATNASGVSASKVMAITVSLPPPPVITSPSSACGVVNQAFSYPLSADRAATFTVSGLPNGLAQSGNTAVLGSPKAAGNFTMTVTASNAGGSQQMTVPIEIFAVSTSCDGGGGGGGGAA